MPKKKPTPENPFPRIKRKLFAWEDEDAQDMFASSTGLSIRQLNAARESIEERAEERSEEE